MNNDYTEEDVVNVYMKDLDLEFDKVYVVELIDPETNERIEGAVRFVHE